MGAKYDPNLELNPTPIIGAVFVFVLLGFATVFMIVKMGDDKPDAAAAAAPAE